MLKKNIAWEDSFSCCSELVTFSQSFSELRFVLGAIISKLKSYYSVGFKGFMSAL